jgi:hypothetical protein
MRPGFQRAVWARNAATYVNTCTHHLFRGVAVFFRISLGASDWSSRSERGLKELCYAAQNTGTRAMFKVTIRETLLLFIILGVAFAWFVDHHACQLAQLHLKYRSQKILRDDGNSRIVVTEHNKPGFMGLQVWQVWRVNNSPPAEPIPLLTVEAGFQERQPVEPIFANDDTITDSTKSFTYSLDKGAFVENHVPSHVYVGPFRYSIPELK